MLHKLLPVLLLFFVGAAAASDDFDETKAMTLFAFDDVSIPHSQNLHLEMRQPQRHADNPVVERGAPGTPDAHGVQFYGSIIKEDGKYRLWYVAFDDQEESKAPSARWRAAYAESPDGLRWTKPSLGLVEFNGNKDNNLVDVGDAWGFVNLKVIKDAADPDPTRRYKMTTHVYFRHNTRLGTLLPFVSADGLTWKPVEDVKPVKGELKKADLLLPGVHIEPCGGLYQWDGLYVLNGQNALPGTHHYQGRVVRTYRSADFSNWSATSGIAFVRPQQHEYLGAGRSREGEQNHEGIAVWNRSNVLLGITGRWHGAAEWRDVTIDLGFVLSNDGLNFREPQHDWTFLERGKDGQWDQGGLLQGQGFENIGDLTFIYYGAWDPRHWQDKPERGGIGIATLPRDRFGDLRVDTSGEGPGDYQLPTVTAEFVTGPLEVSTPHFFINADGLSSTAQLQVELLDHLERPIAAYSGKNAALVTQSGFQTPIVWQSTEPLPERVRLRVRFEGQDRTRIRFSALYLQP
ncbi:MAG: hypothetical protein H7A55_07475 [Verrucomicrobiaceae bacterium]|nr:hypothetical protein [Verrucomicrobiaceae bacterium]